MFTGIVETTGTIRTLDLDQGGLRLTVEAPSFSRELNLGASISVNGACLTVVDHSEQLFSVEIVPETVSRTIFGGLQIGDEVNLERPLRLSDRIDGHLVQGHVDGVGHIVEREKRGNSLWYKVEMPTDLIPFVIEKGSIALDGISLTIAGLKGNLAAVSIIPHTASITTFGSRKIGDEVNVEVDMIGRYVASFVHSGWRPNSEESSVITETWLKAKM